VGGVLTSVLLIIVIGAYSAHAILNKLYPPCNYAKGMVSTINSTGVYSYNLELPSTTYCCQKILNCVCEEYMLVNVPELCCSVGNVSRLLVGDYITLFVINDTSAIYNCVCPRECSGIDLASNITIYGLITLYFCGGIFIVGYLFYFQNPA